jgi:Zn-dependent protease/predicted transcriptional regulator
VLEAATDARGGQAAPGMGLHLARVAQVDVFLNWTGLLAAVLLAGVLAAGVFPAQVGGLSDSGYAAMGVAAAVLFFASSLLRELGHALAARREGISTRAITLWMLGGVWHAGGALDTLGGEARVAVAGQAVSALLGAALVGAGEIGGLPGALATVLEWVGAWNLLLLTLNTLPAFPLDGGRLLRAALWRLGGSRLEATRVATRVSQALSIGVILVGVMLVPLRAGLGLWLGFVGWFVFLGATAERRRVEAESALAGVRVADVMTPDPATIAGRSSARELLELRRRTGHTVFPVVDQHGDAIGLISVVSAERLQERRRDWVRVRELLAHSPEPFALEAEAEVLTVVPTLLGHSLHRAVVLRAGRLVGLISLSDVSRAALSGRLIARS